MHIIIAYGKRFLSVHGSHEDNIKIEILYSFKTQLEVAPLKLTIQEFATRLSKDREPILIDYSFL